ncbi:hypothetical protein DXG01_001445 [Tephrocybe rancida]|nr:hypothetical protein DXG01_001445 [Tephrocybe rancida]
MKFARFLALASLAVSALGADINTIRVDVASLANSSAVWRNKVLSFPVAIGRGTVVAVEVRLSVYQYVRSQRLNCCIYKSISTASAQVVTALEILIRDAAALPGPLAVADGLALINLFNPVAQGAIDTLHALQARKEAIAALPIVGSLNALLIIRQALELGTNTTETFRDAFARYVFTGEVLNAWNSLAESVINEERATINFYNNHI